jgi:hypothetical protein
VAALDRPLRLCVYLAGLFFVVYFIILVNLTFLFFLFGRLTPVLLYILYSCHFIHEAFNIIDSILDNFWCNSRDFMPQLRIFLLD